MLSGLTSPVSGSCNGAFWTVGFRTRARPAIAIPFYHHSTECRPHAYARIADETPACACVRIVRKLPRFTSRHRVRPPAPPSTGARQPAALRRLRPCSSIPLAVTPACSGAARQALWCPRAGASTTVHPTAPVPHRRGLAGKARALAASTASRCRSSRLQSTRQGQRCKRFIAHFRRPPR